jgi:hypothetical protein
MFRQFAGILANLIQLFRDFSQFIQTHLWKCWSSHYSSTSFNLRTCDQMEVPCLAFHKTRVKMSVWTPTILTKDFLGFPYSLMEISENASKQHHQFIQPGKAAREETPLTCIRKIFDSNLGRNTYCHFCFCDFPLSIQANVRIVSYDRTRPLPSTLYTIHSSLSSNHSILSDLNYWQHHYIYHIYSHHTCISLQMKQCHQITTVMLQ